MSGVLYIVATPIGNLEDITLRALRVLKEVNLVAAEDTRHTQHLLAHYGIKTALTSYHEHNERSKAPDLVERLIQGADIALVSDAGTPAISDPGYRLVVEAIHRGIRVVPIPGASALAAALSAAGLPTDRFFFAGFLAAKSQERKNQLQALRDQAASLVFYEAPHRLQDTLTEIHQTLGDREIVVAREVSKIHEEFWRGTVSQAVDEFTDREVKGEITIVLRGSGGQPRIAEAQLKSAIQRLTGEGMGVKAVSELLAESYGLAKREVYRLALELKSAKRPK